MTNRNQSQWVNEEEVAKMTGISLSTLRKHRHFSRGIPYSKVGRSVRYELADVIEFMAARKIVTQLN